MFLFPSRYEGFGIPPLEAMALKTPVVAAKATSLPEVLGDAALFANPMKPEQWAQAMTDLLDNPRLCSQLKNKGTARAKQFANTGAGLQLVKLFRELEAVA